MSIKAESIFIGITSMEMEVNTSDYVHATVQPTNATDREICWESNRPEIVSINLITGQFYANKTGDATITAFLYSDPSIKKSFNIHVKGYTSVESISFPVSELSMDVNATMSLNVLVKPSNATNKKVTWRSCCPEIASVSSIGIVTAISPGIVEIYATTDDGNLTAKCEIWVRGKTPVFLIHGRTSNSQIVWGIKNLIPSGKNDGYNSYVGAHSSNAQPYTNINSQSIQEVFDNPTPLDLEKPVYLGRELLNAGYKSNINLFVFNYPNEDAVIYNAKKFEEYINNLVLDVKHRGSNEKKVCFFKSRSAMNSSNFKINIVGHSMGGLVARYYIENMGYDSHVDKLITICTPHWGSGYADFSSDTGIKHVLCDHDLDRNSAMYGGSNPQKIDSDGCNLILADCADSSYTLTGELNYSKWRYTTYYAIAGFTANNIALPLNNSPLELPSNLCTYEQIEEYIFNNKRLLVNVNTVGDDMVGFMSQIGWTEKDDLDIPSKKITFYKIFVNIDTDGGNGILDLFHSKMPRRKTVTNKVIEYLS